MSATQSPDPYSLLNVKEVAALLGCSTRHVRRLRKKGKMPKPLKLGQLVRWRRSGHPEMDRRGLPDRLPLRVAHSGDAPMSVPTVFEVALQYVELGWRVIPVHHGTKRPHVKSVRHWSSTQPDRATLRRWFVTGRMTSPCWRAMPRAVW